MTRGRRIHPQPAAEAAVYLAVGQRFRNARKHADMSQQQVAELVGLTRGAVANIELGHQGLTLAMFLNFCDALNIEPEAALGQVEREEDDGIYCTACNRTLTPGPPDDGHDPQCGFLADARTALGQVERAKEHP